MDENYTFETRHVNAIAWNSSGTKVAITTSDWVEDNDIYVNLRLKIVDANSGQIEVDIPAQCDFIVYTLTWRKDDKEIVFISAGGEFRCFDVQAGCQLVNQWEIRGLIEADFNPSRTQVALVASRDRSEGIKHLKEPEVLEIYDIDTGNMLQNELLSLDYYDWITWSPDGSRIATSNRKGIIKLYQWNGSKFVFEREFIYTDKNRWRNCGAWSPDGRQLALIENRKPADIAIYDIEQQQPIRYLDQSSSRYLLVWSADGHWIASFWSQSYLDPTKLRIWDSHSGQIVEDVENVSHAYLLAWSPNNLLALGYRITYEEWLQNPTRTGVNIYRPKFLSPP